MRTTVTVDSAKIRRAMRALNVHSKSQAVRVALDEVLYRKELAEFRARCGPWFKWDDRVLIERHLGHRGAAIREWEAKHRG